MLLAELNVRHTRRHMPTRRVALGDVYLPMTGAAYGAVLLGAVVSEFAPLLDEELRELLPRLVDDARDGLAVPRIALRYRLQVDTHGLDRSRHRILGKTSADGTQHLVLELDHHSRADPQVVGAVLGASALPPSARMIAIRAVDEALRRPRLPTGIGVHRLLEGAPDLREFIAPGDAPVSGSTQQDEWRGIPADRRWAMEVLGLHADMTVARADVQSRFRRLVRLAHPDHGGERDGAAERLAQLREARELLLAYSAVVVERHTAGAERTG
jgi:hypothetical protein